VQDIKRALSAAQGDRAESNSSETIIGFLSGMLMASCFSVVDLSTMQVGETIKQY